MLNAVDTNVLVRFLVDDGSEHVPSARRVFSTGQVFVPLSVMLESEWVLRSSFGFQRSEICDAFDRILGLASVTVQDAEVVQDAVAWSRRGLDFADAIHLRSSAECETFYTFDGPLIRKVKRIESSTAVRRPGSPRHVS